MLAAAEFMHIARTSSYEYPLVSLFVDFSKAFDSIDRLQLRKMLSTSTVPTTC
jgi:hypothetical protein